MIRRGRKFFSREFRERFLYAHYNSNDAANMIVVRSQVQPKTVKSWIYQKSVSSDSHKNGKSVVSSIIPMEKDKLPTEAMEKRIRKMEWQLAQEKMRSTCLDTMIDVAEREFKIAITKIW